MRLAVQRITDSVKTPIPFALLFALAATACGGAPPVAARAPAPPGPSATATATVGAAPATPDAGPAPSTTGTDGSLPQTVAVLAGRLRLHMPTGARVAAMPHSVMAADASDEDQTRVIVIPGQGDAPRARFVMLASETFLLGTGDAAADADKLLGDSRKDYRVSTVTAGAGLGVVTYAPKGPPKGQPVFVLGAMVERADHSLVELNFYILNEMAAERARYEKQALAITRSVEPGTGAAPGSKHVRLDPGTGTELIVDLPRAAVVTRQQSPDFLVFHVREIERVGEEGAEIGVYVGGYPSLQYKQANVPAAQVRKSRGTLLGKPADWYTWQSKTGQTVSEAMGSLGKNEKAHVFVVGPTARVAALRTVAEAMHAEKKR